jgi:hypothetical protein
MRPSGRFRRNNSLSTAIESSNLYTISRAEVTDMTGARREATESSGGKSIDANRHIAVQRSLVDPPANQ